MSSTSDCHRLVVMSRGSEIKLVFKGVRLSHQVVVLAVDDRKFYLT